MEVTVRVGTATAISSKYAYESESTDYAALSEIVTPPAPPIVTEGTGRVKHRLTQAVTLGGMTMLLGLVWHVSKFLAPIRPFVVAGALLAWAMFFFSTVFSAELLTLVVAFWLRVKEHAIRQAEIALQKDLNKDGSIGAPQIVERAVPVYMAQDGTVLVPGDDGRLSLPESASPIVEDGQRWMQLSPSTRKMRRAELVHFLETSFNTTTDSHDGWSRANWRERGMSPKLWADVQNCIKALAPIVWKTADRPTLEAFLAQIAYTGTDRTGTGPNRTLMDEPE